MGKFEGIHILSKINDLIPIYVRYIDDTIFIWKGTKQELLKFTSKINLVHPTIKFDCTYSKNMYKQKEDTNRISVVVTYKKWLMELKKILNESWSTLHVNKTEKEKFKEKPLICFRCN